MKVKRVALLMGILALSGVILTACDSQENGEKQAKKEEPVSILVAAAASLEHSFVAELIPMFEKMNTGITVEGTYDSSGKLQTQIEEGLEADLFFSAATKQMDALTEANLIDQDSVVNLLENKIVLIVSKENKNELSEFEDINKVNTVAIGDPESVPAGQYAKEALTHLSLWDSVVNKASLGTNVTEVLHWVAEGSADAGIVYATDAATTQDVIVIALAPEGSLAAPVVYPAGIVTVSKKKEAAQRFLDFLTSEEARAVFEKYGFTPL